MQLKRMIARLAVQLMMVASDNSERLKSEAFLRRRVHPGLDGDDEPLQVEQRRWRARQLCDSYRRYTEIQDRRAYQGVRRQEMAEGQNYNDVRFH